MTQTLPLDSDSPSGKSQLRNVLMEAVLFLFFLRKLNDNWWTGGKWRQEDPLRGCCNDPCVRGSLHWSSSCGPDVSNALQEGLAGFDGSLAVGMRGILEKKKNINND